jgi:sugar phosphate isomerase/epimerase
MNPGVSRMVAGSGGGQAPAPRAVDAVSGARPRILPRILLKARPLPAQLANRLAAPQPDGVELYIHEHDVAGDDWFEILRERFGALEVPEGFTWIVEGPVWSLDGELFGICRNSEADRELTRRLLQLAEFLGAAALNVHCVDGSPDEAVLDERRRVAALERAYPFLAWFVAACRRAGVAPLIENVPPICRMRRAAFIYTPIGVAPRDLIACAEAVPGLGLTLDTSHAQLAVNAFGGRAAAGQSAGIEAAARYYRELGQRTALPVTLTGYIEPLLPWTVSAHISNAAGLLDEGLPYDQGDADLDGAVRALAARARYLVTEPLDADEDAAPEKRRVQAHLERALGAGRQ